MSEMVKLKEYIRKLMRINVKFILCDFIGALEGAAKQIIVVTSLGVSLCQFRLSFGCYGNLSVSLLGEQRMNYPGAELRGINSLAP